MIRESSSCWASARTRSKWVSVEMVWRSTDTGESWRSCNEASWVQALSFEVEDEDGDDSLLITWIFSGKCFVGRELSTRFEVGGSSRKSRDVPRGVPSLRGLGLGRNRRTSDMSRKPMMKERGVWLVVTCEKVRNSLFSMRRTSFGNVDGGRWFLIVEVVVPKLTMLNICSHQRWFEWMNEWNAMRFRAPVFLHTYFQIN